MIKLDRSFNKKNYNLGLYRIQILFKLFYKDLQKNLIVATTRYDGSTTHNRTTMASTEHAFHGLLSSQMVAFAAHMASQYPDLDQDKIIQMANDHCADVSVVDEVAALPKRKKTKKRAGTPRVAPGPEERCMARVWQTGSGMDQCFKSRADGDYCKSHAKKAIIGELAIQVHPDSQGLAHVPASARIGLWCGRIDEFQDGESGVPPYKDPNGVIRIEWTSDDMKARVASDVDAGTASFAAGGNKKTRRKTKKVPDADADALLLADELEQSNGGQLYGLLDALALPEPEAEPVAVVVETKAEPVAVVELLTELVPDATDEVEEEMEVEGRTYEGETYYVDPSTGDIYNLETGNKIGIWKGDAETGSPYIKLDPVY